MAKKSLAGLVSLYKKGAFKTPTIKIPKSKYKPFKKIRIKI